MLRGCVCIYLSFQFLADNKNSVDIYQIGKMGVKDLWSILEPTLERKTLNDLNGLVVAVDLSIWICQLQAAVQNPIVVKPHLRLTKIVESF